jgi:hypothetical protein
VLPVRIELTTSALPRMRSTTELRQHRAGGSPRRSAPYGEARAMRQGGLPFHHRSPYPPPMNDDERQRRLAEALRANLKRRKAQARGETPGGEVPASDPPVTTKL